jgi:hypothetical protein
MGVGIVLSVPAAVIFANFPTHDAGDIAAIEADLGGVSSMTPNSSDATPSPSLPTQSPEPLWQPNEAANIDSLEDLSPQPVGLTIKQMSVDAPVLPQGIDPRTGQMKVPRNVTEVGWYQFGPSPGRPGSAVLAAHVDLEGQGKGVFFELKTLNPGDRVSVDFDDGSRKEFAVEARTVYTKEQLPLDVIFSRQGAPVLTLITCGGGFDSSSRSYDSNVVVYARPISPTPPPSLLN